MRTVETVMIETRSGYQGYPCEYLLVEGGLPGTVYF